MCKVLYSSPVNYEFDSECALWLLVDYISSSLFVILLTLASKTGVSKATRKGEKKI